MEDLSLALVPYTEGLITEGLLARSPKPRTKKEHMALHSNVVQKSAELILVAALRERKREREREVYKHLYPGDRATPQGLQEALQQRLQAQKGVRQVCSDRCLHCWVSFDIFRPLADVKFVQTAVFSCLGGGSSRGPLSLGFTLN